MFKFGSLQNRFEDLHGLVRAALAMELQQRENARLCFGPVDGLLQCLFFVSILVTGIERFLDMTSPAAFGA